MTQQPPRFPAALQNRFGMHVTARITGHGPESPRPRKASSAAIRSACSVCAASANHPTWRRFAPRAGRDAACVADIDAQRCDGLHALFNALLTTLPDKSVKDRLLARVP